MRNDRDADVRSAAEIERAVLETAEAADRADGFVVRENQAAAVVHQEAAGGGQDEGASGAFVELLPDFGFELMDLGENGGRR